MAEVLADQANGMDRLVYLGGWKSSSSASRYIQRAIAKRGDGIQSVSINGNSPWSSNRGPSDVHAGERQKPTTPR